MTTPFVAEIRMFGFNFAPTGWAQCNGQLLPISQNTALFSLLGTYYGGDGKSTFALPNLQDSVPVHTGGNQPGPGLQVWDLGEMQGSETVTLLDSQMPAHAHSMQALNSNATSADPGGNVLGKGRYSTGPTSGAIAFYNQQAADKQMDLTAATVTGSSFPHNNMMPFLAVNFCIAMQGVFPSRP
jgi:microcystin-dependent protein